MILPNKYISVTESFIGISGLILDIIGPKKCTVDKLWNAFSKNYIQSKVLKSPPTHQKFIYALDFMYLSSMIGFNEKGEVYNENLESQDFVP